MAGYKVKIDIDAISDINDAYLWYEEQLKNLGSRYKKQVIKQINDLKVNPFIFTTRYADIHCMKIKKFPFMVHFTVTKNVINVFAVLHTSRNPKIWNVRKK